MLNQTMTQEIFGQNFRMSFDLLHLVPSNSNRNSFTKKNITHLVKKGENTIEVRVTPCQLNGFIGEAQKGNKLYLPFIKRYTGGLMPSGMVGPVVLYKKIADEHQIDQLERHQFEAEKKADEKRITNTAEKLKTSDDKPEITLPEDEIMDQNENKLYAYISKNENSYPCLRLHISSFVDENEWLFVKSYLIKVDGKTYKIAENVYGEIKTESIGEKIWETLDRKVDSETFEIMKAVAYGKNVEIRYNGKDYFKERAISSNEKLALRNVLEVYKALGRTL